MIANRIRMFIVVMFILIGASSPANAQNGPDPILPSFDPDQFVDGVANPYFPLTPGTLYVYEGVSDDTVERIRVFVMHETHEVMGVDCVVVRDTVWQDGELVEDTFDWYAQDQDGNVWYMGEASTEYEAGEPINQAGSWEAGVDGAQPGIIMWAEPPIGEPYYQEYSVGEAEDAAEVIELDGTVTTAYGDFDELVVIREWNPLDPTVTEYKYYAEGIGLVLEEVVEGGEGRIELIAVETDIEDADLDEVDLGNDNDQGDEDQP